MGYQFPLQSLKFIIDRLDLHPLSVQICHQPESANTHETRLDVYAHDALHSVLVEELVGTGCVHLLQLFLSPGQSSIEGRKY